MPTPLGPSTNQYCMFLKPWVTAPGVRLDLILDLTCSRIAAQGLTIDELIVFPGRFLSSDGLMERHYGTLVQLARDPEQHFSPAVFAALRRVFGAHAERATLIGGFEFLDTFPGVSAFGLELIWENVEHHRLGAGAYCGRIHAQGAPLLLVNGFVPNLLRAYAEAQSAVIVFVLRGELPWARARRDFIGASDPRQAVRGSLRREFYERQQEFGVCGLRHGANGVHFSAGPLECLVELLRFRAAVSDPSTPPAPPVQFAERLAARFPECEVRALLDNPTVSVNGRSVSLFELTEECDEPEALGQLALVHEQLAAIHQP